MLKCITINLSTLIYINMPQNTWQLSWNSKGYDFEGRMKAAAARETARHMKQSWGRSPTTNISKIQKDDIIYISCKGKCVAKAHVTRPFYQTAQIQTDEFVVNQQKHDERHVKKWYCEIYIDEIYFDEHRRKLRGNQNTFCNPTNAFWKN